MTMHYQKTRISSTGNKIFIGEDAHPYSDGNILVVADGLGGRGGYPHSKVSPEILVKENFYNLVFAPIFEKMPDEAFIEYVMQSFSEIFQTAPYYFENSDTMRSSGYFASRLISCISVYLLKFSEDLSKDKLFERIYEVENCEDKESEIAIFCDKFALKLAEMLKTVANNINLQLESRLTGAYLLPSTLTVALVNEKESSLDVIYLWAGDTRGYVWNEEGLKQITDDHEKHETMTNLITLSKPFAIDGAMVFDLKKPCILFNASDGCYKCPVFASPFDLEYIFLDSIRKNSDFSKVANSLQETFKAIGTHDDSNTMALKTFGFENYSQVTKAVLNRLENIDKTIISKLPGILEIDYGYEVECAKNGVIEALSLTEKVLLDEEIKQKVIQKMLDSGYNPYLMEIEKHLKTNAYLTSEYYGTYGLSAKESAKRFTELQSEDVKNYRDQAVSKLMYLIDRNWEKGVKFSLFDVKEEPYFNGQEFHYEDSVKEQKVKICLLIINKKNLTYDGDCFVYGDMALSVPEEEKALFSKYVNAIFASKQILAFIGYVHQLNDYFAKEYYLKECSSMAKEIFEKLGDGVRKFEDQKVNSSLDALEIANKNFALRQKLYAEYEVGYTSMLRSSEL